MARPELRRFLDRHYETVIVDVGHFDRNLDIPAHYGLHDRLKGVPSVLIVDSRTDRLVNVDRTAALSDARHLTPQRCPTG